ncbi:hypothetical protein MQE36_12660 [Zhouia spongiae]|uniref:Uncharacterized protein n=1 Tax=Zhouia spongiae TaxID=2202721 RepID=A0ABY3YJA7_9FLAO|nr:hypothetical protein [Zhouia spongiae]UNY97934.1 hypothetical protein MQE36_12660 [Zhouia spongiae]
MNTTITTQKGKTSINRMNNFLKWYLKIQNVNPITNEKFDTIMQKMKNQG